MEQVFLLPIYFLLGSVIGSFLNVLIDRLPNNQNVVSGRSQCPRCKKNLMAKDLVPIMSFALLRGKCRYCKKPIDWTLPVVEVLTGVVFVLVVGMCGVGVLSTAFYIFIACLFIVVFFMDLKYGVIEDKVVLAGVFGWVIYTIASHAIFYLSLKSTLTQSGFGRALMEAGYINARAVRDIREGGLAIACGIVLFLFFYLLVLLTKGRGMGGGDVKFSFLVGVLSGFPNVFVSFFVSFLTGAIFGVILILLRKKGLRSAVPFGPFLVIGTVVGMVFGDTLVRWYIGIR